MTIRLNKKKIEYLKILTATCLVATINVLLTTSQYYGTVVATIQAGILLVCIFRKQFALYTAYYVIMFSLCIEFSNFVGEDIILYNIKETRVLGINLGIWVVLPVLFFSIINVVVGNRLDKSCSSFSIVSRFFITMIIIAALTGMICILVNDNNITGMKGYMASYAGEIYSYAFLPVTFISLLYLSIKFDSNNVYLIPFGLQATLVGVTVEMVLSFVTGVSGSYGSNETLLCSTVSVFLPVGILLAIKQKEKMPYAKITAIICLIGTLLSLRYNSSGKTILMSGLVLVYFVYSCIRYGNKWKKAVGVGAIIMSIIIVPVALSLYTSESDLFSWKLYQAKSLFQFGANWIENMPFSPKVRLGELGNVVIEYCNKPWLALLGKGFLGSVPNYLRWWNDFELILQNGRGAYTLPELYNNSFYTLHEISGYFLIYGTMGITFAFYVLKRLVKLFRYSVWAIIGVVWFVLLYGYSFTLSTFGICCFMYAFMQMRVLKNEENEENEEKEEQGHAILYSK